MIMRVGSVDSPMGLRSVKLLVDLLGVPWLRLFVEYWLA